MNNQLLQKLIQKLAQADVRSFNFKEGEAVTYDPVRMWQIFYKKRNGIDLTSRDKIDYMKALCVAVFDAVNFKSSKQKKKGEPLSYDQEFEYLSQNVRLLDDFYMKNMNTTVFKEFPTQPNTKQKIENFQGYLFNKACWLVDNSISDEKESEMRADGIDPKKYKAALRTLEKQQNQAIKDLLEKKKADPNKDWDEEDKKLNDLLKQKVNVELYRNKKHIYQQSKRSFEEISAFVESAFSFDRDDFAEIDSLSNSIPIDPSLAERFIDGKIVYEEITDHIEEDPNKVSNPLSTQIEAIAQSFGVYDEPKMKALFNYFNNNLVREINTIKLWGVKYYQMDMPKLWMTFHEIDRGGILTKEGKEFLLMQYLMIAISVYKNHKDFQIDDKKDEAQLNRDQMMLMTLVISGGYKYFMQYYKTTILTIENSDEREAIFSQVRSYFVQRINKARKDPIIAAALPMAMMKAEIGKPIRIKDIELDSIFDSEKTFNDFILRIKTLLSKNEIFEDTSLLKDAVREMNKKQVKTVIKSVLKASGYKIIAENETDSSFLIDGLKSSIHFEIPRKETKENCLIGVTFHNDDFDKEKLKSASRFSSEHNAVRSLAITTAAFSDDFNEMKRKVSNLEAWDLIDLVGMIQQTYNMMSDEDRNSIDDVIEELILDF